MIAISKKTRRVTGGILVLFFLFVALFIWKLTLAVEGPTLTLDPVSETVLLNEPLITISGTTDGGNSVIVNGTEKSLSLDGSFSYDILLNTGFNLIQVETKDARGRRTEKSFSVVLHDQGEFYALEDIKHYQ